MKLNAALVFIMLGTVQSAAQQSIPLSTDASDSTNQAFEYVAQRWFTAYNGTDARDLEPLYAQDAQWI